MAPRDTSFAPKPYCFLIEENIRRFLITLINTMVNGFASRPTVCEVLYVAKGETGASDFVSYLEQVIDYLKSVHLAA
jgi:hypothetical protein